MKVTGKSEGMTLVSARSGCGVSQASPDMGPYQCFILIHSQTDGKVSRVSVTERGDKQNPIERSFHSIKVSFSLLERQTV